MEINEILEKVDALFEENRAKEAEELLLRAAEEARAAGDFGKLLQILNELIGYYRQTSEKEQLLEVIREALELVETMGLSGTVVHATTALNAANGYRSIGEKERALELYQEAGVIYQRALPPDDLRMAGYYNNLSLLYQELQDFKQAEDCLLRALKIVKKQQAGFEIAVTYANLANTCVMGKDYPQAKNYAKEAIARFEERQCFDAHYCAALSALGMCFYQEGQFEEARALFKKGMELVEQSLGRNAQYQRLVDNLAVCEEAMRRSQGAHTAEKAETKAENMRGLELCRLYYETYGKPMIKAQFADYEGRIAVGLCGRGSDCLGFDDAISRDHDWGPDFCLWVTDETYAEIGQALEEAYSRLPEEFMGYRRTKSAWGAGRRGVRTISGFYKDLLGTDRYEDISWQEVEDYHLAAAVSGEVFRDDEGLFSDMRRKLQTGYPADIRLLKLAEDVARVSQTGQYNYFRLRERQDLLSADGMLADCMRESMKLLHHFYNAYPPHDKWLRRSTEQLPKGAELLGLLEQLHACISAANPPTVEAVKEITERIGNFFATLLYANNDISDMDSYIDMHTQELVFKAQLAPLSKKELVDRVARLEFKAFDLVKNEGGRAYCQNDWPTFSVMRKSQYLTWDETMLRQYLYDFQREFDRGHNLITEKYGRMMESTAPEEYARIKDHFPMISPEKQAVIQQIVAIQMEMVEAFAKDYPGLAHNARNLHTYEDNLVDTSYETYLRGEISTYSDKMLQLYGRFVVQCAREGINIAKETITNTAKLYGYPDLESFEKRA